MLSGDTPLLTPELLRGLVETHRREGAAATVLSFEPPDPRAYGRLVRDGNSRLARIVEAADATPDELELREVNSSIYVFAAEKLWPARRTAGSAQRARRALSHRRDRLPRRRGRAGRDPRRPRPDRRGGRQHTRRARRRSCRAARPHQRGAHARGRHDRRPAVDVDRRRRRDRARRDHSPVHGRSAATSGSRPASRSARSPSSVQGRGSARARRSAPSSR